MLIAPTDATASAVWIGTDVVSMVLGACGARATPGMDEREIYFLLANPITTQFIQQDELMSPI